MFGPNQFALHHSLRSMPIGIDAILLMLRSFLFAFVFDEDFVRLALTMCQATRDPIIYHMLSIIAHDQVLFWQVVEDRYFDSFQRRMGDPTSPSESTHGDSDSSTPSANRDFWCDIQGRCESCGIRPVCSWLFVECLQCWGEH